MPNKTKSVSQKFDCGGLSLKHHQAYTAWLSLMMQSRECLFGPWQNFVRFLDDLGDPPAQRPHLGRLDSKKPHSPQNSLWVGRYAGFEFKVGNTTIKLAPSKAWAGFFEKKSKCRKK